MPFPILVSPGTGFLHVPSGNELPVDDGNIRTIGDVVGNQQLHRVNVIRSIVSHEPPGFGSDGENQIDSLALGQSCHVRPEFCGRWPIDPVLEAGGSLSRHDRIVGVNGYFLSALTPELLGLTRIALQST